MPNVAKVLKEEIQRLAKKEARDALKPLQKEVRRLKTQERELRREVDKLKAHNKRLVKRVEPVIETTEESIAKSQAQRIRPTANSVKKLRKKFKMTQAEFAKLLGVSSQSVTNWETQKGRLQLHSRPLEAIAGAMEFGAREARKRLEELTGADAPVKPVRGNSSATKKKSAKPSAKKKSGKKKTTGKKTNSSKSTKRKTRRKSSRKK